MKRITRTQSRSIDRIAVFLLSAALFPLPSCSTPGETPVSDESPVRVAAAEQAYAAAIREILARDAMLGADRNYASEQEPLDETIRRYVAGIDSLDFSECPPAFAAAFGRHRDAWQESIGFFAGFAELRGEMHRLFELIRNTDEASRGDLERIEAAIWETWAEVEEAARAHGVDPV